jgi:hypothetical protein
MDLAPFPRYVRDDAILDSVEQKPDPAHECFTALVREAHILADVAGRDKVQLDLHWLGLCPQISPWWQLRLPSLDVCR